MLVEANGIAVNCALKGQGETVVLIHALGLDLGSWWLQSPVLEERFRVLAYDVRGHGASSKPAGPYSIALFAADLFALLGALRIDRCHLVGLSMGGMIAQKFAADHPERVRRLVLSDTSCGYAPEQGQVFEERARTVEASGMESLVQPTLERWFTAEFRAARPDVVERIASTLRANDPVGYAGSCRAIAKLDLAEEVRRITAPTLIVVGDEDVGTPPQMAREIQQRISGSRLEILPNAAHLAPVEQAEAFNSLMLGFLA